VFTNTRLAACLVLAAVLSLYVIEAQQISAMKPIAIGMLVVALGLEAIDRRENRSVRAASISG
jgi:glucose uptake protein GlcU